MVTIRGLQIGCILTFAISASEAISAPSADGLLRGVESVRSEIESLRTVLVLEYLSPQPSRKLECLVDLASSGQRRRFEILPGVGTDGRVTILNGQEVHTYVRRSHSDVSLYGIDFAANRRGDMFFDPRLLGLTDNPLSDVTIRQYLWYDTARELEVVGQERLNEVSVWKVRVVGRSATSYWWIEEPSFRVHRRTIETNNSHTEIKSYFDGDKSNPLPSRVHSRRVDESNRVREAVVSVQKLELGKAFDDERFTMHAMDVPLDTAIVDHRIHRVVGYWDGKGLSKEPSFQQVSILNEDQEVATSGTRWRLVFIAANVAVIIGLVALVGFRRMRLRHSA